jgi:hypothetical protein
VVGEELVEVEEAEAKVKADGEHLLWVVPAQEP